MWIRLLKFETTWVLRLTVCTIIAARVVACHGEAVPDKSGVKPSTISLPSGAGSIEGLGESFEPQLNTGSSAYGVAVAIPPGRAGLQPKVRLSYNSGLGNSSVGLGWTLDLPTIKRQTDKGFPSYTAADVFVFDGEELVPLSNAAGDWRCENESAFQRFRQIDSDNDFVLDAWEMTERNGTRHIFGKFRGQGSRWSTVEHPNPPAGASTPFDRTYCWALNTTIDLHGNRVEYEYLPPYGNPGSSGILYPSRIIYSHLGGNYHEVRFRYEDRPDKFDDYRPTFAVTIGKRLADVEVHSFYDGVDHLVRAYALEYAYRPEDGLATQPGSIDLGVSTLKRIVQRDRSGNPGNYLPPLLFEYSQMNLDFAQLQSISPPGLELAETGGSVQIADVDGDSLPDIIKTADSITGEQIVCMNRGEFSVAPGAARQLHFSPATIVVPFSSNFRLSDPNSTLTDIDGDGLTDLVRIDPGDITGKQLYIFGNNSHLDGSGSLGFSTAPQILFSAPPEISFNSPDVRQMDVNFDKQSDFVLLNQDLIGSFHYYFRDRDSGAWIHSGPVFFNPDMTGYAITFDASGESNPRVQLTDMNGDRLLDLVYLDTNGSGIGTTLTIRYWPYCGLGRWGVMRVMTLAAGDNFQIDALDLRDVLVQDLTGDGLSDIAVIRSDGGSSSSLDLRVNVAGRAFTAPTTFHGLPRHLPRDSFSPTTFRQADLNANGSTDLIWRNQTLFEDDWQWLDLLPNGKPNLLTRIDNNLGKRTEITYGNAVDDMIRARETGYPWKTRCPFPMQVVRHIRTTCGFDLDGITDSLGTTTDHYVSEFMYRDAYYDGFEREFRGFAFAQRVDYGDDFLVNSNLTGMGRSPGWDASKTPTGQVSAPTLVTRFRYLTGAADGVDNDEYPGGWSGPFPLDEVTARGGREEEILKGRQVWEEKVDPWVLHEPAQTGDFDRAGWLALNSTNALERTRMTPDAFVYSRARQEWAVRRLYRPIDPGLAPPGRFASSSPAIRVQDGLGGSGRSVSYAFVANLTNEVIEANGILSQALGHPLRNPILTAKSNDYDDYGNQTVQRDYGVVGAGSYDDERFTTTQFALDGDALTRWILDKPARTRTTDENGVFVSESRNYYDGSQFQGLPLGQIGARALPHRAEQVVTDLAALPPLAAQSDQPGDPRLAGGTVVQKARSAFDAFGNILTTLDPLGNPGDIASGHARQLGYDSAFQTFPTNETIVVGGGSSNLVLTANYDPGFGVITSSTDFNSNVISYEYDSFARLVAIVKPFDSPTYPTALFQYLPGDPNRARLYSYDRAGNLTVASPGNLSVSSRVVTRLREQAGQGGTHVSASYSDGCGRKLAEIKESEVAGQWIVSAAHSFNRRMTAQSEWLTAQLSGGTRVRRLRYARGWNLLAPAVDGARLPSSPELLFVTRWNSAAAEWQPLTTFDTLTAQSVLWLWSDGDGTMTLRGAPVLTASRVVNGPTFLSGWGFEVMPLVTGLPTGIGAWLWDSVAQTWCMRSSGPLNTASELLPTLDADRALFVLSDGDVTLPGPDPMLTICFFHEDHLGSSSIVADGSGRPILEDGFYAFGITRYCHQSDSSVHPYLFTQNERDAETCNDNCEARYLKATLARFFTVDPVLAGADQQLLPNPQRWNSYAYCVNRPLTFIDPSGMQPEDNANMSVDPSSMVCEDAPAPPASHANNSGKGLEATGSLKFEPELCIGPVCFSLGSLAVNHDTRGNSTLEVCLTVPIEAGGGAGLKLGTMTGKTGLAPDQAVTVSLKVEAQVWLGYGSGVASSLSASVQGDTAWQVAPSAEGEVGAAMALGGGGGVGVKVCVEVNPHAYNDNFKPGKLTPSAQQFKNMPKMQGWW